MCASFFVEAFATCSEAHQGALQPRSKCALPFPTIAAHTIPESGDDLASVAVISCDKVTACTAFVIGHLGCLCPVEAAW